MQSILSLGMDLRETRKTSVHTCEFGLVALRETAAPGTRPTVDTPEEAHKYIRANVINAPGFRSDVETFSVLFVNARRKIIGHMVISQGTLDTLLIDPRAVFKGAILANAAAVILTHHHPSGDPSPSEADIKVTRDLIRGGQILKIEVLDHLVTGHPQEGQGFVSLKELGYFYS